MSVLPLSHQQLLTIQGGQTDRPGPTDYPQESLELLALMFLLAQVGPHVGP